MNYKILSATVQGAEITTSVKFDFLDLPVDVYHSRPQSLEDIATGILNRGVSEQRNITDISTTASLLSTIETGVTVEL